MSSQNAARSVLLKSASLAAVAALALTACTGNNSQPTSSASQNPAANEATVIRVIDGDTFVATTAAGEKTIRLLNVDTPETKDPNAPVECLGPEATAALEELLPVG